MMGKQKQIKLTEGPILKTLLGLALPIMASSFLGTIYNIMDMAWIGVLGSKAVAAVGVGGMYIWLSQSLSSLAKMGAQVYVAQCIGQGRREKASEYAKAALQLTFVFAFVFAMVCVSCTDTLVGFFRLGDDKTIEQAVEYMKIVCGLVLFSYLNVVITGIYTAQGNSKTPFFANLTGLIVNMILDPVLIFGLGIFPEMGVSGAAIATVTAQAIATGVLAADIFFARDKENILNGTHFFKVTEKVYYAGVFKIGGPTAIQSAMYCMISMVLARMAAAFGADAVAVQRVGGQIESISWNTADGFAAAMNALAGQNYGAGKMERVRKGYQISFITMAVWGSLIMFAFLIFPDAISRIFFHEPEVIRISAKYLIIIGFSEACMCIELMTVGTLSGLGKTRLCSVISILMTASRIPIAMSLCKTSLGLNGVWWAMTLTSVAKGLVFFLAFYRTVGKMEKTGK
ncbi:MAG: MATE family efflux transporter [Lachnospiraceae bacterium]